MSQNIVKEIHCATRRTFTSEQKIRIVLEGLREQILTTSALEGTNTKIKLMQRMSYGTRNF